MPQQLKTLAQFTVANEALAARDRLEQGGIPVTLDVDPMAGWSWHQPATSTLARLSVAEADYDRASRLLAEAVPATPSRRDVDESEPLWPCPRCATQVEPFLDVCWSCGTTRDGRADPDFEPATAPIVDSPPNRSPPAWTAILLIVCPPALVIYLLTWLLFRAGPSEQGRAGDDAPPAIDDDREPVDVRQQRLEAVRFSAAGPADFGSGKQPDLDALLLRAWRTAVLGVVCLPPLLTLYSTWLILKYLVLFDGTTARGHWRVYLSLAVNLLVLLAVGYAFYLQLASSLVDLGHAGTSG